MKNLVLALLAAIALSLPARAGVTISTSPTHSGAASADVLLVNQGETFTYSVSGTWVGQMILQRSFDGVNFSPVYGPTGIAISTGGLSGAGNSGGTYSGTLTHESADNRPGRYRLFASSYTSGAFVTVLADADDFVQEFRNRKNAVILTLNDDTITTPNNVTLSGTLAVTGAVTQAGAQTFNGNVTVGDAGGDIFTLNAGTVVVREIVGAVDVATGTVGATSILNIDGTNRRLGIGTRTPTVALDVAGAAAVSGALTLSSATLTGSLGIAVKTNAFFDAATGVVGAVYLCSDCTIPYSVCVGTGATISGWKVSHSATVGCGTGD